MIEITDNQQAIKRLLADNWTDEEREKFRKLGKKMLDDGMSSWEPNHTAMRPYANLMAKLLWPDMKESERRKLLHRRARHGH